MKLQNPKSILIVKLSSIGDVIHALPVARVLRRHFPQSKISWLVSQKAREIVSGNPDLDHVIVVGGKGENGDIPICDINHPVQAARTLRSIGFDVALDLQGLIRSSLFSLLSGADVRIGYRSIKEAAFIFYNVHPFSSSWGQHVVDGYLRFAAVLGAPVAPVEFCIATNAEHEAKIDELLDQAGLSSSDRLVAISPGSSWRAKTWPAERLAVVAGHIAAQGCVPVVVGAKVDIPNAKIIAANSHSPVVNLAGQTNLKQLTVLLRRCTAFIGNDSGPTHLAAAVGKPVIAIYGPTDSNILGPYGAQNITISADVPCRPCRRRSKAERCYDLSCLDAVTPEMVCQAVDVVLARTEQTAPVGAPAQP